jgi:hypothetical protein
MQPAQAAEIDGHRNIVIQIAGSGNITTVTRGTALTLKPLAKLRSPIRNEIDILKPASFAIPYIGRKQDLADLQKWLRSEQRISVRVLIGRGGSGKTRLALRLLEDIEAENERSTGWQAGFADHDQLRQCSQQPSELTFSWTRPTLVVVDYAATAAAAVRDVIRRLPMDADQESTAPIRMLLLERHADATSGWLNELKDRSWTSDSQAFFDPPGPVNIEPIATPEQRRDVLRGTLRAAAQFHPPSQCKVPAAGTDAHLDEQLAKAEWQDPLVLMMAALTAIETGWRHAFSLSRTDLAKQIAAREAQRIGRFGSEREGKLLLHMAAVVTLHGGLSGSLLLDASREECAALSGTFEGGAGALVDRLTEALPSTAGASPVLPDIVGEAFVLSTLADAAQHGTGTVLRAVERDARAVTAVIRTAVDFYRAEADGSRGRRWLDDVFECLLASASLPVLRAMEASLPVSSLLLDQIRFRVVQKLLILLSDVENGSEAREELLSQRARLMGESARMLSALGRREDALSTAQQATDLYRELARARPDAFLPDLAMSLNNLAKMLSDLGRREDALATAQQAVDLRRELARARPDAFLPNLAVSLNNLAKMLSDLGHREDALATAQQATDLYRELARARPDAFLPNLAMSLNNLAAMLSDLDSREDALATAQQAADLYRELARARPDAFLPNLAMSLSNLAAMLSDLGRREEALSAAQQAVDLRRELARARPDAFLPNLAMSLNTLAKMLSDLGRREEALATAQEAVDLRRELARARPDAFLPNLAVSLNTLANMLSDLGRREDALATAQQATDLYRELARARPDAFLPDLAMSLNNLAIMQSDLGRREDALAAAKQAVDLRRELARARPDAFLPDLVQSLWVLGDLLVENSEPERGFTVLEEALAAIVPLAEALPGAFRRLALGVAQSYLAASEKSEREPNHELLARLIAALQSNDTGEPK